MQSLAITKVIRIYIVTLILLISFPCDMPPKAVNTSRFQRATHVRTATDDAPLAPTAQRLSPDQKTINALTQRLEIVIQDLVVAEASLTTFAGVIEQLQSENFELKAERKRNFRRARQIVLRKQAIVIPDEAVTSAEDEATSSDDSSPNKRSKPPEWSENKKTKQRRVSRWATVISDQLDVALAGSRHPEQAKHGGTLTYLCRPENKALLREAANQTGLLKEIAEECVLKIEEHWGVELGLFIQDYLRMSDRAYQLLINVLSSNFTESKLRYVSCEVFEGVKFPAMGKHASLRKVKDKRKEIFGAFDPQVSDDKLRVTISLPIYLEQCVKRDPTLLKGMRVLIFGDGAPLCRGKGQVTFAVDVKPMLRERTDEEVEAHEDQPSENSYIMSLMCYEGAEKREALEVHLERFIREAKGLATSEGLSVTQEDGTQVNVPLKFLFIPDKKMKSIAMGHQGSACKKPCDACETPWEHMHEVETPNPYPARTIKSVFLAAHLPYPDMQASEFPYTCSYCDKTFHNADEMRDEEQPKDLERHCQQHASMYWHVGPLFDWIDIDNWIEDLLHFLIRNLGTMWAGSIESQMTSEAMAEALAAFTSFHTGCCVKVTHTGKGENAKTTHHASFIGREARTLLNCIGLIIDFVFGKDDDSEAKRATVTMWAAFLDYWVALCKKWKDTGDALERKLRADELRELGRIYVDAAIDCLGAEKVTPYQHDAPHHVPDNMEKHGDLWEVCTENGESLNADKKRIHVSRTNKRPGRMEQILSIECSLSYLRANFNMRSTDASKRKANVRRTKQWDEGNKAAIEDLNKLGANQKESAAVKNRETREKPKRKTKKKEKSDKKSKKGKDKQPKNKK